MNQVIDGAGTRSRIVIAGAGYAGYHCSRHLERRLPRALYLRDHVLGPDTVKGRIVVDEFLTVPGHPDVFAAGDAAAAPDLTRPGQLTAMTAQHAQRQGKAIARNLAATLGHRAAMRHSLAGGLR